jgi:tripartite-type tricarboxylate transporter receptor subunit TctC
MFAPRGTPALIVEKLAKALQESLKDSEVIELSKRINIPLFYMNARQTIEQIKADEAAYRPQMEALGLAKK